MFEWFCNRKLPTAILALTVAATLALRCALSETPTSCCQPQVAAVGHTTESAQRAGLIVDVYEAKTSGNAGGSFYGRGAPGTS